MKRILFASLFIISAINCQAQVHRHYPLSVLKDTAEYLHKNFIEQKEYFVGKTLKEVVDVYKKDLPLKRITTSGTPRRKDPEGISRLESASLDWLSQLESFNLYKISFKQLTNFKIVFKPPYKIRHSKLDEILPEDYTAEDVYELLWDLEVHDIIIKGKYAKGEKQ